MTMDYHSSLLSNNSKHRYTISQCDLAYTEEEPVLIDGIYYDVEADTKRTEPETEPEHFLTYGDDNEIPFAEACLEPLLPIQAVEGYDDEVEAQPVVDSAPLSSIHRPEFLFASAIKPFPDCPIGVTFKKKDGSIYISNVKSEGLFYESGLKAGDRVVAVNNVSCLEDNTTLRNVLGLIAQSSSTVSLCVYDKQGEPSLVLSSVQKPRRDSKLGISFQMRRGALTVSKVSVKGLYSHSLLMPDHRVFYINGQACDHLGSQAAVDLTASARRVTIISRARGDLATVLSVQDVHNRQWVALAMGAGVAAAALSAVGSF